MNDCCDEIRNKNQTQARTSTRQESKANNHRLAVAKSFEAESPTSSPGANEHKPGAQTGGIKSADQKDEIIHKQLSFFRFYIPYFF